MMAMDVRMEPKSEAFILEQAVKFPKEVRRAFLYACGITLRVIRGRMSGKNKNIAKWDDFTRKFRAQSTIVYCHRFGGRLMYPNARQLTMSAEGDQMRVGWIGAFEDSAKKFQEGGSEPTSKDWRHWLYTKGFVHGEVPTVAVTPERPVIAQTIAETAKHVSEWVLGAFDKILHKRIKAWELRYTQTTETKRGRSLAERIAASQKAIEKAAQTMEAIA